MPTGSPLESSASLTVADPDRPGLSEQPDADTCPIGIGVRTALTSVAVARRIGLRRTDLIEDSERRWQS